MHTKLRTLKLFRQKRRIVIGRRKKELEIERELKTIEEKHGLKENIPNLLLKQAFEENEIETIKVLLNAGGNIHEIISEDGKTLLHLAAQTGNIELLEVLLSLNNKDNVVNIFKDTIRVHKIEYIKKGQKIVKYDEYNCLHTICGHFTNNVEVVSCLLNHCISKYEKNKLINSKTKQNKDTPLHLSCKYNNDKVVKYLLRHNANYWCKDHIGRTALDVAYTFNNINCVNAFEDYYRNKGIAGSP